MEESIYIPVDIDKNDTENMDNLVGNQPAGMAILMSRSWRMLRNYAIIFP